MSRTDYLDRPKKRFERSNLLTYYGNTSIIGLCGPNMDLYVQECKSLGFKNITLYENNFLFMLDHYDQGFNTSYVFNDIYEAEVLDKVTYDLDFTQRIDTLEKYVVKFNTDFVFTVCEARVPNWYSIGVFLEMKCEKMLDREIKVSSNQVMIRTEQNTYLFTRYADHNPMMMITKIKNL